MELPTHPPPQSARQHFPWRGEKTLPTLTQVEQASSCWFRDENCHCPRGYDRAPIMTPLPLWKVYLDQMLADSAAWDHVSVRFHMSADIVVFLEATILIRVRRKLGIG
jgi:hypothetical protein